MHDYVAAQVIRSRQDDIERAVRRPRPGRRQRSWRASATADAMRAGLVRAVGVVGARRPSPNES